MYCWQCLPIILPNELYHFLLREIALLGTIKTFIVYKGYGENLIFWASRPWNSNLGTWLG